MARIRTVKPDIFTDAKTGTLSAEAFRVFVGLLTHADDYGVAEFEPKELRVRILPFLPSDAVLLSALDTEIIRRGLARIFEFKGKRYLWIPNFLKHQRINRPSLPLLEGWGKETTPEEYVRTHGLLTEGSLGNGRERNGVERNGSGVERNGREGIGEGATTASATAPAAPPPEGPPGAEPDGTFVSMAEIAKSLNLDANGRDPKGQFASKDEIRARRELLKAQAKKVLK